MRIVDALRDREQARRLLDPNAHELFTGTPQEQEQARRARARHMRIAGIFNNSRLREIPRSELDFEALGGRMIEHVASRDGDFYHQFGGDPQFTGDDVTAYYVTEDGTPVMLQRASSPSSRADLERIRARKEQRRLDQEEAAKEHRRKLRAAAR